MKDNCYKDIVEQACIVEKILKKNKLLMEVLDYAEELKLPNYYVAAGSIFQTIWNYYDKKDLNYNIKDFDIIYYNKEDITVEKDLEIYKKFKNKFNKYKIQIDITNEARMHIWSKENYNKEIQPYKSSEDAITRWIATIHAIGITKENNKIKIFAPYGLNDIFTKTIKPIKHIDNNIELYNNKVDKWKKRFNNLNIINWND